MSAFTKPLPTITPEQIEEAIKHGFPAIVIINGEYYTYKAKEEEK